MSSMRRPRPEPTAGQGSRGCRGPPHPLGRVRSVPRVVRVRTGGFAVGESREEYLARINTTKLSGPIKGKGKKKGRTEFRRTCQRCKTVWYAPDEKAPEQPRNPGGQNASGGLPHDSLWWSQSRVVFDRCVASRRTTRPRRCESAVPSVRVESFIEAKVSV